MTTQTFKQRLVGQFRRPTGCAGTLAGWIMALRPSNRLRNAWAVEQLDVQPDDRVLEVGFGPGLAQAQIARKLGGGRYVGIDHSETMVLQASRRNRAAIERGHVQLSLASVEDIAACMPGLAGPFTKILAINVAMFWRKLDHSLRGLHSALAPGGRLAIAYQPRMAPATDEAARAEATRLEQAMRRAGFSTVETHELDRTSPITVCVLGTKNKGHQQ